MSKVIQAQIVIKPRGSGFHLITQDITDQLQEKLAGVSAGLLHLFIQHTSASLTINENADADVRSDLQRVIDSMVPEKFDYHHTIEGPDDMPAHVKASLLGNSLTIPIQNGRLCLGTWQGIYLGEHRHRATARNIVATIFY